jgi:hypothetical protein
VSITTTLRVVVKLEDDEEELELQLPKLELKEAISNNYFSSDKIL